MHTAKANSQLIQHGARAMLRQHDRRPLAEPHRAALDLTTALRHENNHRMRTARIELGAVGTSAARETHTIDTRQ